MIYHFPIRPSAWESFAASAVGMPAQSTIAEEPPQQEERTVFRASGSATETSGPRKVDDNSSGFNEVSRQKADFRLTKTVLDNSTTKGAAQRTGTVYVRKYIEIGFLRAVSTVHPQSTRNARRPAHKGNKVQPSGGWAEKNYWGRRQLPPSTW